MCAADQPGIAIIGPTASGKTSLGLALAIHFRGEIVSCDALQVYRGMDIGTAKPTGPEREILPHHMLDLRNPGEDYSAGDYQRDARAALERVRSAGHIPFVVGGTGFYLRALIDGFFAGPSRSETLRNRLQRIAGKGKTSLLHKALSRVDSESAGRIEKADAARLIRAYEVYLLTGKPMGWWRSQPRQALQDYRWLKLGISHPRALLYQKINQRVYDMFAAGFVEEVRSLIERYPRQCHAFKAIGYRQIADYLDGKVTLEHAVESTQRESRRYAKRQLTWFRSDPDIVWLDGSASEEQLQTHALEIVKTFIARDD
jgi:tRNA dimethylallyltransferase